VPGTAGDDRISHPAGQVSAFSAMPAPSRARWPPPIRHKGMEHRRRTGTSERPHYRALEPRPSQANSACYKTPGLTCAVMCTHPAVVSFYYGRFVSRGVCGTVCTVRHGRGVPSTPKRDRKSRPCDGMSAQRTRLSPENPGRFRGRQEEADRLRSFPVIGESLFCPGARENE